MARYCFVCDCGVHIEVIRPMKDASKLWPCDLCGKKMQRDYQAENVRVGDKEYSRPIVSDSLAISPEQVNEHKKLFPDVKLDNQCRPVFDNYRRHDEYLRKTGFIKSRQRIRKKGKRIKSGL